VGEPPWGQRRPHDLFFLVVGLEIKRELVAGELSTWRKAALPVVALFYSRGVDLAALALAAGVVVLVAVLVRPASGGCRCTSAWG
jgi:Na+/H+ antiporter NhaA